MENKTYAAKPDTNPIHPTVISDARHDKLTILMHVDDDMYELFFVDINELEVRSILINATEIVRMYELIKPKIDLP